MGGVATEPGSSMRTFNQAMMEQRMQSVMCPVLMKVLRGEMENDDHNLSGSAKGNVINTGIGSGSGLAYMQPRSDRCEDTGIVHEGPQCNSSFCLVLFVFYRK